MGSQFDGMFRWLNNVHPMAGDGFGVEQYSEADALIDASQFHEKYTNGH